jgi:hypothetical protein
MLGFSEKQNRFRSLAERGYPKAPYINPVLFNQQAVYWVLGQDRRGESVGRAQLIGRETFCFG